MPGSPTTTAGPGNLACLRASTLAAINMSALVGADWLVEIEAVAVMTD